MDSVFLDNPLTTCKDGNMNWYLNVMKNYITFDGRARRKEYWMFFLINIIILLVLSIVDGVLFGGTAILSGIYALIQFLPQLAVSVRRLHDTDRSGWWILLGLIPIVGLVLLVFFCLNGTPGSNRFGADPKA